MAYDETFWGGLGQRALKLIAVIMGLVAAAPAILVLVAPFIA